MKKSYRICAAIAALLLSSTMTCGALAEAPTVKTDTAELHNFISGMWEAAGDNGMPTPENARITRAINAGLDVNGDAIAAVDEQDIRYFNGKYYLYGQDFRYGTFHYAPGTRQWPVTPTTPNSNYRFGGLTVYSSDDLMNWTYETTNFMFDQTHAIKSVKKPRVIYSEETKQYVLWFLGETPYGIAGIPAANQTFSIAVSDSPTGPFTYIGRPNHKQDPTGNAMGADYEICVAPDGTGYLINSHNGVSISRLGSDMMSIEETINIPLESNTIGGGIGLHYHDGWWYVTGSGGCGNCVSSGFWYIMAKDPMGPWMSPETMSTELPLQPVLLAESIESAQVHSAKSLPDGEGNMNVLIPATHYRRDLGAPDASGNNVIALTGHYYLTLEYDGDGHILPLTVDDTETFPLAAEVETTIPGAYEAQMIITASDIFEHTDRAEVKENKRYVEQSWDLAEDETLAAVLPVVFQATPDYSAAGTTRPDAVVEPQDSFVNAPLHAKLDLPDGTSHEWDIDVRTIMWAPARVALNLPQAYTGAGRVTLTLSTEGTNGAFGVAVGLKENNADYLLRNGSYRTFNEKDGGWTEREAAEMLVYTSAEAISAPVITQQPVSVSAFVGDQVGFYALTDGIGVGYQWKKDGEPIYSEYSAQSGLGSEATAPCFRLQDITAEDAGEYTVEVMNGAGSVTSVPVTLTVNEGYSVSGSTTVHVDGWNYLRAEKDSLANLNAVAQIYKAENGEITGGMLGETLVRSDGRYRFEVGYNGDPLSVDGMVPRMFGPGSYAVVVKLAQDGVDYSATEYFEITDGNVTVDLMVE